MRRYLPVLVVLGTVVGVLAVFEGVVRLRVRPSKVCWGTLGKRELPPWRIVPGPASPDFDPNLAVPARTARGDTLTRGDIAGIFQEDPEIGFVWAPSRASRHGWWRANALGAREDGETPRAVPEGRRRLLIFGDSFAAGTRLPGPSTWTAQLERLRPDLDVVNFGVDGYGMGQSYLLFRRVRAQLDWDAAVFLFVPRHDSWRDINVSRWVGERWLSYAPQPRFVLAGEGVRLVSPPYRQVADFYASNWPQASPELRQHLRAYDRFYDPLLYEPPPVVGHLVSWKLLALWMAERRGQVKRKAVIDDLDGEAFTVCERVLRRAGDEAEGAGRALIVALLPAENEVRAMRSSPGACARWRRIVERLQASGLLVVDLAPALVEAPVEDIDHGADDSHYGPRASARLAAALSRALPHQGFRFASSTPSGVSMPLVLDHRCRLHAGRQQSVRPVPAHRLAEPGVQAHLGMEPHHASGLVDGEGAILHEPVDAAPEDGRLDAEGLEDLLRRGAQGQQGLDGQVRAGFGAAGDPRDAGHEIVERGVLAASQDEDLAQHRVVGRSRGLPQPAHEIVHVDHVEEDLAGAEHHEAALGDEAEQLQQALVAGPVDGGGPDDHHRVAVAPVGLQGQALGLGLGALIDVVG
jgi:hypothetical protein